MVIVIALIGAAKGEKMVAFQHSDIVAEKLVLAVPETGADVLSVNVIRRQSYRPRAADCTFAKGLKSPAELGELRHPAGIGPRPEVTKVAEVEIVGRIGGDVGGQPGNEVPGLLRTRTQNSWSAQLIASKTAANINLARGRSN